MADIRKLIDILNETTAGSTSSGGVAPVAQSFHETQRREPDLTETPEVLEYGNWENSALTTSKKLKSQRRHAAKVVKSVYGEDNSPEQQAAIAIAKKAVKESYAHTDEAQEMDESNAFTDARMNAIKAGKNSFKVGRRIYKVTGDISDELEASKEGVTEMDKSAPQPGRDGTVSHSTYGTRDEKGSDYFKGEERPVKHITWKQAQQDALNILKKQGVVDSLQDEKSIWNQYGHYTKQDLMKEFPNITPQDAQAIVNYAEYGWSTHSEAQKFRDEFVKRIKMAMGQQGVAEGKYDPAKDTFSPETHTVVTKDGKDIIIPKDELAKYKASGWKERHSLKAFHANREKQGVAEENSLEESDLILNPAGMTKLTRGFVPHDHDRTDHEVDMARSDLFQASKNAKQIFDMIRDIDEEQGLEGWVQEKIIKAADYLNTVREYLEGKQLESIDGVGPSTRMFTSEGTMKCIECGGIAYSDEKLAEAKDACYNKVKSRYKVWPSAYASGALVKCRKVGAKNWGNKAKK